jgi:predicted transcriptional regulator
LREAGSYGYLVSSAIPEDLLSEILEDKKCKVRIEVPDILPGGVAIYGKDFGRYPLDPTLFFNSAE